MNIHTGYYPLWRPSLNIGTTEVPNGGHVRNLLGLFSIKLVNILNIDIILNIGLYIYLLDQGLSLYQTNDHYNILEQIIATVMIC